MKNAPLHKLTLDFTSALYLVLTTFAYDTNQERENIKSMTALDKPKAHCGFHLAKCF